MVTLDQLTSQLVRRSPALKLRKTPFLKRHKATCKSVRHLHPAMPEVFHVADPELLDAPGKLNVERDWRAMSFIIKPVQLMPRGHCVIAKSSD